MASILRSHCTRFLISAMFFWVRNARVKSIIHRCQSGEIITLVRLSSVLSINWLKTRSVYISLFHVSTSGASSFLRTRSAYISAHVNLGLLLAGWMRRASGADRFRAE